MKNVSPIDERLSIRKVSSSERRRVNKTKDNISWAIPEVGA